MDFTLTPEQVMLQDALSRFLRERCGFEERRRLLARSPSGAEIWEGLAELGLLGAAIPENLGGLGGGAVETMVIMEALGGALVVEPYLETAVIGGGVLKRTASPAGSALASGMIDGMIDGKVRLALAALEPTSRHGLESVTTTARREGGQWVIAGAKSVVRSAPSATHLLVTARTSGGTHDSSGISLFVVEPDAPGLTSHAYRLLDDHPAADLVFDGVRVSQDAMLGAEGAALPLLEQVRDEAIAAVCAEAVGGMRRLLHDTIEYTKQRRQFGQPLATFQVLQHRMVDMFIALERAVSAVYLVTLKLDADPVTRALAASAAKATVAEAARFVGQNAVQLHGAMGMTDELAVGHYFKRATVIETQFGSRDYHLARYARLSRREAA